MNQLLSPIDLSPVVRGVNRIVMPPMVIWSSDLSGMVMDAHRNHYQGSAPGCGLVIVEATAVAPEGRLAATQLGCWDDSHIPGLASLAQIIRECGAVPGIQLHHAGKRTSHRQTGGCAPMALSHDPERPELHVLTDEEITAIIDAFAAAARRVVEAGFTVVELHGAHGYLGSQSLAAQDNCREDRWGGTPEKRLTFLREVIRAVREVLPADRVLACRLGVADGRPGHLSMEEGLAAARALEEAGTAVLHISHGGVPPADTTTMELGGACRKVVSIPVIAVGGITTPEEAEAALENQMGDMIAVGRGILADPYWAARVAHHEGHGIIRCRDCQPRCHQFREPERCPARAVAEHGPPGSVVPPLASVMRHHPGRMPPV